MFLLALNGLSCCLVLAIAVWLFSLALVDASIADRVWSLLIAAPAVLYASVTSVNARGALMLALLLAWAVQLAWYVTVRNWGQGEDRRYRAMRERHGPNFGLKSGYLVFGLQGGLAWVVGWPFLAALGMRTQFGVLDLAGALIAAAGVCIETVADYQLSKFLKGRKSSDSVMDQGFWAWSRYPNYFGEACTWWGLGLMALAAGGWSIAWSLVSPVLMTLLLLKVSGVALLERDIGKRRPAYRDYMTRTSAFILWPPRQGARW